MSRCSLQQINGVYTCNELIQNSNDGAFRWFQNVNIETTGFGIDSIRGGPWGTFCTDRFGRQRVSCGTEGALIQYVKPGVRAVFHTKGAWLVMNPWHADYVRSTDPSVLGRDIIIRFNRNLEGAIVTPN
jgi:hypothetical protein